MALRNWRVQFTATLACIVLAFTLGDRLLVDKPPSVDEDRPKVVIHGKEFFVPEHYPKDAFGKLQYDKKFIKEVDTKTTDVLRNMCKHNAPSAQPSYKDKRPTSSTSVCFATSYKAHVCAPHICIWAFLRRRGRGVIPTQRGRFFTFGDFLKNVVPEVGICLTFLKSPRKGLFGDGRVSGG